MISDSRATPLDVITLTRRPSSIKNRRPSGLAGDVGAGGGAARVGVDAGAIRSDGEVSLCSPEVTALAAHTVDQKLSASPGEPVDAATSLERGPTTGPGAYAATVKK